MGSYLCAFIFSHLVTLIPTSIIPSYRLTDEQNNVLRVTEKGHNVFITGQGGTELHLAGRRCVCFFLRAKGFPWISPVGHILELVLGFDREFVTIPFQGYGSVGGKNRTRFEVKFVFNEGLCLNK